MPTDTLRQHEDGLEDSEHSGFETFRTVQDWNERIEVRRRRQAHGPADLPPADEPPEETGRNATYPYSGKDKRESTGLRCRNRFATNNRRNGWRKGLTDGLYHDGDRKRGRSRCPLPLEVTADNGQQ